MNMSRLLRIVTPIPKRARRFAIRVLLRLALLRQMPLAVRHHLAHVLDVVFLVLLRVLLRVLLEDRDDLATAVGGVSVLDGTAM